MSKPYTMTENDCAVLYYFIEQTDPITVKEAIGGTGMVAKDVQYSVTKLTNAGYIETTGKQAQTNPDGSPRRGRPSRLIAITDAGREALAAE